MRAPAKSKAKSYGVWRGMIGRCTKPKHSRYPLYGARGIKVCDRWMEYDNFKEDMGEPPPGLWLDRINNDGNYEPTNCRWATPKEQSLNRRNTRHVQWLDFKIPLVTVCEMAKINPATVKGRIKKGYTEDEALFNHVEKPGRPHRFKIVWNGKETTLAEICEQRGLNYQLMFSRVARGWDIQTAVITPVRKKKRSKKGKKSQRKSGVNKCPK